MSRERRAVQMGMAPELARQALAFNIQTGVTSAGTALADAYAIVAEHTTIATAAASSGVRLPDWPIGTEIYVKNSGANTVNVYPHSATGTIEAGGAGAAQTIATTKKGRFIRLTATNWDYTLEN